MDQHAWFYTDAKDLNSGPHACLQALYPLTHLLIPLASRLVCLHADVWVLRTEVLLFVQQVPMVLSTGSHLASAAEAAISLL